MPGLNAREIRVIPVVVEEWNSYIFWIPNDVDNLLKKINLFLYGSSPKTKHFLRESSSHTYLCKSHLFGSFSWLLNTDLDTRVSQNWRCIKNHQGILLKCRFSLRGSRMRPALCICSKLPGDVDAAGPLSRCFEFMC